MALANYRVRRATLDDIPELVALWNSMHFPADDLARRITEFQVALSPEGKVIGAIGMQMSARQGLIHSEGFTDFAVADQVRPLLWERLQSVAANHGLLRVWTNEQAPFWSRCGLAKAEAEIVEKLPASWRSASAAWLTLKLKEDLEEVISADKEFALFMQSERQRTQRALQHARVLKFLATAIAVALLILVVIGAVIVLRKSPMFQHR